MPIFILLIILLHALSLNNADAGLKTIIPCTPPLVKEVQGLACLTSDLRQAVQKDDLLKKISNIKHSKFEKVLPPLSWFGQSVRSTINNTHTKYQQSGKENYTLHIVSYPLKVHKNSCQKNKTIDLKTVHLSKSSLANKKYRPTNYFVVAGKKSRNFQTRVHNGQAVYCEKTKMSPQRRLQFYCGAPGKTDNYDYCKKNLAYIPTCAEIDKKAGKHSSSSACVPVDNVENVTKSLLSNEALAVNYCPEGCSWYTQTVQRVYKKKGTENEYCSDNYLIVHCGPQRAGETIWKSEYNLNIKEIKNICSDFGHICPPTPLYSSTK